MLLERVLVFLLVLVFFFPIISKVVRLASRTWDEREYLEDDRVRQIVFGVPIVLLIVFIIFYVMIIYLLELIVFV